MKRVVAVVVACVLLVGGLGAVDPEAGRAEEARRTDAFIDISTSFAEQPIRELYVRGVVAGRSAHLYEPQQPVTRAEFLVFLSRALNVQPVDGVVPVYHDVPQASCADSWTEACSALGITEGGPSFVSTQWVTREEAATLVMRSLHGRLQKAVERAAGVSFADDALIAPWARPYVEQAAHLQLMQGGATGFEPGRAITREEAAAVLWRMLHVLNGTDTVPVWQVERTVQVVVKKGHRFLLEPTPFFATSDRLRTTG